MNTILYDLCMFLCMFICVFSLSLGLCVFASLYVMAVGKGGAGMSSTLALHWEGFEGRGMKYWDLSFRQLL